MNEEQKRRFAASKKEKESLDVDDYSCRKNKYRLRRKDRENDKKESKSPCLFKMEANSDGKQDVPLRNVSIDTHRKTEKYNEISSLYNDNHGEKDGGWSNPLIYSISFDILFSHYETVY